MMPRHLTVTAIRQTPDRVEYEVFTQGADDPLTLDLVADELKRRAGTYEETNLEKFLKQQGLELITKHDPRTGAFRVRIGQDVCIRDPRDQYGLLSASAEGSTPAAARRELSRKVSGRTLVAAPMFPIRREYQAPELGEEIHPTEETGTR